MKKILYGLTLLAAMASCTDNYDDWAQPQSQPQENAKNVTFSVAKAPAIDYANVASDDQAVQLFVPSVTAEEGTETTLKAVLWNADQTASKELNPNLNGNTTAAELKSVVEALYGKAPVERTIAIDVTAYTADGEQTIASTGATTLNVTLVAPFIDEAYYLVGDMCGWSKDAALPFKHLGDGNVYDNPEYQIIFKTTDDNQYWKIVSGTGYDADNIWAKGEKGIVGVAVDGDDSMEGNLMTVAADAADPGAGKIAEAGIYRMTIDMMNYTYKLEKLDFEEYIYVPGNAQKYNTSAVGMPEWGWTPELAPALHGPNYDGVYTGYAYMDGEFKFTRARNWNAEYNYDSFTTYGSMFTGEAGKGGNINCTEAGYYQLVADVAGGSLKATKLTWGLVGPATAGGWDAGQYTVMNYNMADDCWEITTALGADEYKFTTNGTWDINLGGSLDDLSEGGGNLRITEAGTYNIKLYPSRSTSNAMYAVVTKQ